MPHRFYRVVGHVPGKRDLIEFHDVRDREELQPLLARVEAWPGVVKASAVPIAETVFRRECGAD